MKKKKELLHVVTVMMALFVIACCSSNAYFADFDDPVLGHVVSDTYASEEDFENGTPSSEEAVRASKPAGYYDYDHSDPAQVRAHNPEIFGGGSSSNTKSSSARTNTKPAAPTLTEYDTDSQQTYVVTSQKAVYDDFNKGRNEIGSVSKGTEVVVTGKSSNGYYRFDYTAEDGTSTTGYLLFEGKDNIVPKEDYEAAWAESNRVEATCTKDGYIEYTNGLSGLKYKDELKATGHVLGDEELTLEPTWTKPGEIVTHCAVCNEVIDSREIPPIVPAWAWWLIGGTVAFCVVLITVTIIINSKRRRLIST